MIEVLQKKRPKESLLESLKSALKNEHNDFTIADAATKSGLSLSDTSTGLNYLLGEYRGHLAATSKGELLYRFPNGFSKPWEREEKLSKFFKKLKKGFIGCLKFVVRAWISIVMIAYVVIFALILIAMTFSKNSDRDEGSSLGSTLMFHTLLRLILDSLFWTFHPFSPFNTRYDHYYDRHPRQVKKTPFYEKVNGFFFGPEEKEQSEQELVKIILQEIRAKKGRVGIFDIMRVTGLSKEKADPLLARLMLNYDGEVEVSPEGGIYYIFSELRKSTGNEYVSSPPPIWSKKEKVPEFTGNTTGSNFLIAGLNGFNLVMSSIAISGSWTIEKLQYIFTVTSQQIPPELLPTPPEGTPLLLGWIPFIFSASLYLLPISRLMFRSKKIENIDRENGRRGLVRTILNKLRPKGIVEEELVQSWQDMTNKKPNEKALTQEIIKLGGELELDEEKAVYRFKDLEAEIKALEVARARAKTSESDIGEIVFSSAK